MRPIFVVRIHIKHYSNLRFASPELLADVEFTEFLPYTLILKEVFVKINR